MVNHPNRSRNNKARNPTPEEIIKKRNQAHLTQAAAGELVYTSERGWQMWEAPKLDKNGNKNEMHRRMHPGLWELFLIKIKGLE